MTDEYAIDLAHLDDEFSQATPAERQEFEEVPNGRYQAYVDKAYLTRSKANNLMLKWELVIIAGPYKRRRLFKQNLMVTAENLRWLKADLQTAGLTLTKLSELHDRIGDLLDVVLELNVRNKGTGEDRWMDLYLNKRVEIEVPAEFRQDGAGGQHALAPF
ncbi:MAG: DUF669 domain-containing protein [Armatimonadota bacterium]